MKVVKEMIVVEGKSDTIAIQRAVDAYTIETGGSAINQEIIDRIKLAQSLRGVIVFTDPDHAGERLRKIISQQVPGCKHAFLPREQATYRGEIGIEHASKEHILDALQHVKTEMNQGFSEITLEDLLNAELVNGNHAASRRLKVGKILGIGYCNGKQFLKRCHMFQITRAHFESAIEEINAERSNHE